MTSSCPKSKGTDRRAYRKWRYWNIPAIREGVIIRERQRRADPEFKKKRREQYALNPEFRILKAEETARYRQKNPEKARESNRRSAAKRKSAFPDQVRAYHRNYYHRRRAAGYVKPLHARIRSVLCGRVRQALKGHIKKVAATMDLIGCTIEHLHAHLESQFTLGMCWGNYGRNGWHIEHRIPCCRFDLTNTLQQRKCFDWRNLQPMWAEDNFKKGRKLPYPEAA